MRAYKSQQQHITTTTTALLSPDLFHPSHINPYPTKIHPLFKAKHNLLKRCSAFTSLLPLALPSSFFLSFPHDPFSHFTSNCYSHLFKLNGGGGGGGWCWKRRMLNGKGAGCIWWWQHDTFHKGSLLVYTHYVNTHWICIHGYRATKRILIYFTLQL